MDKAPDRIPYYKLDDNYDELRKIMTKTLMMKGMKTPTKNTFRPVLKAIDVLIDDLVKFIGDFFYKEDWDVTRDHNVLSKFIRSLDVDLVKTTKNTVMMYSNSISEYLKMILRVIPYNRTFKLCDEFREAFIPLLAKKLATFDFTMDVQIKTLEKLLLDKEMLYADSKEKLDSMTAVLEHS